MFLKDTNADGVLDTELHDMTGDGKPDVRAKLNAAIVAR